MKISEELLISKGWIKRDPEILTIKEFHYDVGKKFFLIINDLSNCIGRNWACHIDNSDMQTIAYVDIDTTEQFNNLMKLMEIDYEIN